MNDDDDNDDGTTTIEGDIEEQNKVEMEFKRIFERTKAHLRCLEETGKAIWPNTIQPNQAEGITSGGNNHPTYMMQRNHCLIYTSNCLA